MANDSSMRESPKQPLLSQYADLQINGYLGIDFNDPHTTVEQILKALEALAEIGVACVLPTVITASAQSMVQCITTVAAAHRASNNAQCTISGIHVEGPFLSPEPGYIGAHPPEHASPANLALLDQLIAAGDGLVKLVTLAPEIDQDGLLTRHCRSQQICVAAGHTNASLADLERCLTEGLNLFTHLGNGCPKLMDRHDNILTRALHFRQCMHFSLIADGFHVPEILFRQWLDLIPQENLIVVSDAISAAGLGPGTYPLGHRTVKIGPDGAARDPSGNHFVGSASSLRDADTWLAHTLGLGVATRQQLLWDNPRRFLNLR